jgi:hypothetical protein
MRIDKQMGAGNGNRNSRFPSGMTNNRMEGWGRAVRCATGKMRGFFAPLRMTNNRDGRVGPRDQVGVRSRR